MASEVTERGGQHVADAMEDARNTVAEKVHDVTDYVREHDVQDVGRDVMRAATKYPVVSLLVLGAVVVGGSMLVAAMLRDDGPANASGGSRRPMALASAASGLGQRGTESLGRIRDAAFSFALDKAVDVVNEMFPGFREHYERG